MSNLYSSTKEDIIEGNYDRPIGVSICAVIMALSSVVVLITQLVAFTQLNEASSLIGVSSTFFQGAITFLGLLGTAGGVGMWLGKKWGWWLAMFYFAYSLTRNVNVMLSIQDISDQFSVSGQDGGMNYFKYGIKTLWDGLLLFYLCRDNVMSFFNMMETKKWKALLIVFIICIVIFVMGSLVALLAL